MGPLSGHGFRKWLIIFGLTPRGSDGSRFLPVVPGHGATIKKIQNRPASLVTTPVSSVNAYVYLRCRVCRDWRDCALMYTYWLTDSGCVVSDKGRNAESHTLISDDSLDSQNTHKQ